MSRHLGKLLLAAITYAAITAGIVKGEEGFPNWQSCALDFWSNVKTLDDLRMGVPANKLGRNAQVTSEMLAEKGAFIAATTIQRVFAACIDEFAKGDWSKPPIASQKYAACAWSSTMRLAILLRLDQGDSVEAVKTVMPVGVHEEVDLFGRYYRESKDKAALSAVLGTQECIAAARKAEK